MKIVGSRGFAVISALAIAAGAAASCSDSSSARPLAAPSSTANNRGTAGSASTASPAAEAEADKAIRDATRRYDQAYRDAVADPGSPAKAQHLLAMYTADSPEREGMKTFLQTLTRRGWAGRPGKKGHQSIESVLITSLPPTGRAETTTCTFDDGVVFDAVNKAPGGGEIIVNDDAEGSRTTWIWIYAAGTWKISEATTVQKWTGEDKCAAD